MTKKKNPFYIADGDTVYLIRPMKVIRRTREGRCLCKLYDREVSIPETLLHNEAAKKYIDGMFSEINKR